MKFRFEKKYLYWGITAFLVIAASILFYYILFHRSNLSNGFGIMIDIAMPIIDGFVLAYLITPVLNKVEKRIIEPIYVKAKIPATPKSRRRMRGLSIFMTIVLILVILYEFFGLVIPQVVRRLTVTPFLPSQSFTSSSPALPESMSSASASRCASVSEENLESLRNFFIGFANS